MSTDLFAPRRSQHRSHTTLILPHRQATFAAGPSSTARPPAAYFYAGTSGGRDDVHAAGLVRPGPVLLPPSSSGFGRPMPPPLRMPDGLQATPSDVGLPPSLSGFGRIRTAPLAESGGLKASPSAPALRRVGWTTMGTPIADDPLHTLSVVPKPRSRRDSRAHSTVSGGMRASVVPVSLSPFPSPIDRPSANTMHFSPELDRSTPDSSPSSPRSDTSSSG